jgi:hypothetical protein
LESKKEMAARDVPSPDEGDALALTFAQTVARKKKEEPTPQPSFSGFSQSWMG